MAGYASLSYSLERSTSNFSVTPLLDPGVQRPVVVSQGLVSKEKFVALLEALTITHNVLGVIALVVGILNVVILSQSRNATFVYYFIGLSVADAVVAVFAVVYLAAVSLLVVTSFALQIIQNFVASFLSVTMQRAGVWLNALACLERFLAVVFPLKAGLLKLTSRKALLVTIIGVFVMSVVIHLYAIFQYDVRMVGNNTYGQVPSSFMRSNPEFFIVAPQVVRSASLYAPLLAIVLLNIAMIIALKVHAMRFNMRTTRGHNGPVQEVRGQNSSRERKPELQVTKMVIWLSFAVVFLQSPAAINSSIGTVHPDYGGLKKEANLYQILNYAFFQLTLLNQPVIFLISFFHSHRFAEAFYQLWYRCLKKPSSSPSADKSDKNLTSHDDITLN